jgi:hypothetical protein
VVILTTQPYGCNVAKPTTYDGGKGFREPVVKNVCWSRANGVRGSA